MVYKKLEGIKPFNELQLKSCYYHQMATAYSLFGIPSQIIVGNYFPFYKFDTEKEVLSISNSEILDEKVLEVLTGVQKTFYKKIDNLEEFVEKQINDNIPVVLPVDCFYLDYREDTYLQKHIIHFILIYGYDNNAKTFIINEHMYQNSYKYIERIVSMDVIITSYKNFIDRLMQNEWSLITLTKKKEPYGIASDFFRSAIADRVDDLKNSVCEFREGIRYICDCLSEQKKYEEKNEEMISFIGSVRVYKNIQKNIIGYLGEEKEVYNVADRIVEDYIFIYGLMVKMKVMKKYNLHFVEKILNRCNELLELESKLHLWFIRGGHE